MDGDRKAMSKTRDILRSLVDRKLWKQMESSVELPADIEEIETLLEKYNVFYRYITLSDRWWSRCTGYMLGFMADDDTPVVLTPGFTDYSFFHPKTGKNLPDGEVGELVITTLKKEGAPLIRYRTHDLTRIIPGECPCGSRFPRIDIIVGRTDDMIKVKGVNMFPAQFEETLATMKDATSEYQIMIDHLEGRDIITVYFETPATGEQREAAEQELMEKIKAKIGVTIVPKAVDMGYLPRSEKKTNRIFDNRY